MSVYSNPETTSIATASIRRLAAAALCVAAATGESVGSRTGGASPRNAPAVVDVVAAARAIAKFHDCVVRTARARAVNVHAIAEGTPKPIFNYCSML